jgi:flavin reductase (DIM6/NTAB) family NADH-FMN oxidoreductase RutF
MGVPTFSDYKDSLMTIEKGFFRQVMGYFATGVTVVTTSNQGALAGITVNAFCSVSLNPPLVLICIDLTSTTLPALRESKSFAVNILTAEQEHLSRGFATYNKVRFENFCNATYHTAATGAPILDNALAFIDARIVEEYPGGDHAIFIGQVEALGTGNHIAFASTNEEEPINMALTEQDGTSATGEASPLIFYEGRYHHLAAKHSAPTVAPQVEYNGNIEKSVH